MKRLKRSPYVYRTKRCRLEVSGGSASVSCIMENNIGDILQTKDTGDYILKFLPSKDLCNVALVSEQMHALASDPLLWDGSRLNQRKLKEEGLAQYFDDCKFIRFNALELAGVVTQADCRALLEHLKAPGSKIEEVDFKGCDLTQIPPVMLAETVTKLAKVNMDSAIMTAQQLIQVVGHIGSSETVILKELRLGKANLLKVPPILLATGISRVEKVSIYGAIMTTEQMLQLFINIGTSETLTLKDLDIMDVDISQVSSDVAVTGISKLEKIDITQSSYNSVTIDTEQAKHIFKKISGPEPLVLKELKIWNVNLFEVPPDDLATGILKLVNVDLGETELTAEQTKHIFRKINGSETMLLTNLVLDGVDLSKVPSLELANGISKLSDVSLASAILTTTQTVAIFMKISGSEILTLKQLNLCFLNLSAVPAVVLATAISKLVEVELYNTMLIREQIRQIFMKISCSKTLITKILSLRSVDLSLVPLGILSTGISNLVEVHVAGTGLTIKQKIAIFKKFGKLTNVHTKDFTISFEHFSEIPPEILVRGISKLGKINKSHWTSMSVVSTTYLDSTPVNHIHFKAEVPNPNYKGNRSLAYKNVEKDMKLTSSDKKTFWVHKKVLGRYFGADYGKRSTFHVKRTKGAILEKIVEFIYNGETYVEQKQLRNFIKSAKALKFLNDETNLLCPYNK